MEFLHTAVALLASMVLVLAGMVGWLYWQQTRISQNMNSIIMVIGELARPPAPVYHSEPEPVPEEEVKPTEEDDRVSVKEETSPTEVVDGPPQPLDTDGLESKTTAELREILTKRGIPFGKRDNKSALITLLKATA